MKRHLLLTCEHYSKGVPERFGKYFVGNSDVLDTHRGSDIGSAQLFESMRPLSHPAFHADWSRLIIELNRSLDHARLFSEFTQQMDDDDRRASEEYYTTYRERVTEAMDQLISEGKQVLHVGVHTFTPVLDGEARIADIGLLYDPDRQEEKSFCTRWKMELMDADSSLRVRSNYPYFGTADGFTTTLRKRYAEADYLGIELEVNQSYFEKEERPKIVSIVKRTLGRLV